MDNIFDETYEGRQNIMARLHAMDNYIKNALSSGAVPYIGPNGNWWVQGVDTNTPAEGPQGATGDRGDDGADGITPTIGTNGNWYLGTVDTGLPSRGIQGEQGPATPANNDATLGGATPSTTIAPTQQAVQLYIEANITGLLGGSF